MLKAFCLFCRLFSMCIFSLFRFLRQTLTKLRLNIQSRMTFNPNLLPLPSVRISDMYHHIWFYVPPGIRCRVLCMLGELGVPPTLVVYSFIYFVMGSHCVAQTGLELAVPLFPSLWDLISGAQLSHPVCPDVLICFIITGNVWWEEAHTTAHVWNLFSILLTLTHPLSLCMCVCVSKLSLLAW